MKAARQKHKGGSKEAKHASAAALQSDPLVILVHTFSCISHQGDDLPRALGIQSSSHLLLALREVPQLHHLRQQALRVSVSCHQNRWLCLYL